MSSVFISFPESTMARLLAHSQSEGLTALQCIEGWLDLEDEEHQEEDGKVDALDSAEGMSGTHKLVRVKKSPLMQKAIELAKAVPVGEKFSLGTLLGKERWDLPSPKAFGRVFKSELSRLGIATQRGRDHSWRVASYVKL